MLIKNINYTNSHADLSGYYIYRERNNNKYNKDHAIINFYQMGEETISNIIKASIIKEIVGNVYFTELRIKEQLGYSVSGKIFSEAGVLYYMILIQGSAMSPDLMDQKIEQVISVMNQRVRKFPQNELEKLKGLIIRKLTKKYSRLKYRAQFIWDYILDNKKNFNFKSQILDQSLKITKKDIL